MEMATPESKPADKTSRRVLAARLASIVRPRMFTIVHCPPREMSTADNVVESEPHDRPRDVIIAVAGGIEPVPLKTTGKLPYLTKELGQRKEIRYASRGQKAPTRKNQTRPLPDADISVKISNAAC